MKNEWKNTWNKRSGQLDNIDANDTRQVFLELKRSNGFDVVDELSYEALYAQFLETKNNLCCSNTGGGKQCIRSRMWQRCESVLV